MTGTAAEPAFFADPRDRDPSDPYARGAETFPRLSDEQVERVSAFGTVEALSEGTVLFERDDRGVDFFLVLDGHIEIYEPGPDGAPVVMTIHAEHQFTGELDLFNDRGILVGGRMGADGRVARLRRPDFRRMLAAEPDIARTVMRRLHPAPGRLHPARRGRRDDRRAAPLGRQPAHPALPAAATGIRSCWRTATTSGAAARLREQGLGRGRRPRRPLRPPAGAGAADQPAPGRVPGHLRAARRDGRHRRRGRRRRAGGLAAAVYAASEGLETLVLESEAPGGQAGTSSMIENYLGFPTGVSGQALADRAQVQAQKFGARIAVPRAVRRLHAGADGEPHVLELEDGDPRAAPGPSWWPPAPATGGSTSSEHFERFEGGGIHYAATAVEAGLCEGEEVVVVGGGNSAGQAAIFLAGFAAHVHILVRGEELAASMSDYLTSRIEAAPERITLHRRTEITGLAGDRHLERVTWTDRRTGETETRPVANVFLMLGAVPNTEWLDDGVELDEQGFIVTSGLFETSLGGVFAVGDVRSGSVKRCASAVGEGSIVVSAVHAALGGR